jgi:hypothetical protein
MRELKKTISLICFVVLLAIRAWIGDQLSANVRLACDLFLILIFLSYVLFALAQSKIQRSRVSNERVTEELVTGVTRLMRAKVGRKRLGLTDIVDALRNKESIRKKE